MLPTVSSSLFDAVVIATPLEHAHNLTLPPAATALIQPRDFRHWYVTVVRSTGGGLDPRFFNASSIDSLPFDNILVEAGADVPFNVVQLEATLPDNSTLWKLFSNGPLDDAFLQTLFRGLSPDPADTVRQHWPFTFPVLKPVSPVSPISPVSPDTPDTSRGISRGTNTKTRSGSPSGTAAAGGAAGGAAAVGSSGDTYQPIVLAPGLYYVNAIESVASAMEGSILAARNIALLLGSHDQVGVSPLTSTR